MITCVYIQLADLHLHFALLYGYITINEIEDLFFGQEKINEDLDSRNKERWKLAVIIFCSSLR
jgi:hypothetical protein